MATSLGTGSLAPGQSAAFVLPFGIDVTVPLPMRDFFVVPTHPAPNVDPSTPKPVVGFLSESFTAVSFPYFTTLGVSTVWVQRVATGLDFPAMNYFIAVMNFSDDPIDFEFFTNSTDL